MISNLFDSSTVPVLEQVVNFTQARHGVLAGNLANLDTPGYRTRDLSQQEFETSLKEAVAAKRHSPSVTGYNQYGNQYGVPATLQQDADFTKVEDSMKSILYHDESDVSLEQQVAAISKNQAKHNLALSLMTAQFRLLRAAITERA
ncbi:flagellar basal body rod protein FlgB [Adhaeretor mobilis]|uniref:Flagellar basal body rod protein FlgB n=1 Tax=Adhaeretor mobilis TaxID=1930276 RepID=A0A517MYW3_9BACT|nr:flagellar basal body rod protein FlgB [Adhaeretor mobilis]QDT00057.1 flagellar basal body rod protein FlgB [Adhaeretor mobilis]